MTNRENSKELKNKIFELRRQGRTVRQIAKIVGKGPTTVQHHLRDFRFKKITTYIPTSDFIPDFINIFDE